MIKLHCKDCPLIKLGCPFSIKTQIFLNLVLHDQRKQRRGTVAFLFAQTEDKLQQDSLPLCQTNKHSCSDLALSPL